MELWREHLSLSLPVSQALGQAQLEPDSEGVWDTPFPGASFLQHRDDLVELGARRSNQDISCP